MSKGVLILAFGDRRYLYWAETLAASIKAVSSLPITICSEWDVECKWADVKVIPCPTSPAYAKLNLHKLTPYEETIYVDADSICVSDPSVIFQEKGDYGIDWHDTYSGKGDFKSMLWAKPEDFREHFGEGPLIATNSSVQLIRKSEFVDNLFDVAFSDLKNRPFNTTKSPQGWGHQGAQPDELYINGALCQLNQMERVANLHDHIKFWWNYNLGEKPVFLSFAGDGKRVSEGVKGQYDRLARFVTGGTAKPVKSLLQGKWMSK